MSIKKIIAIGIIYIIGWAGWWTLGTITSIRSNDFSSRLGPQVEALWGTKLSQQAPSFSIRIPGTGRKRWLMPSDNNIKIEIIPDYRKKGLLWYSTYNCIFDGVYSIENTQQVTQKIYLHFDFPAKGATYDEFSMHLDDRLLVTPVDTIAGIDEIIELAPGEKTDFKIHYKTRGIDSWKYLMAKNTGRVQNFSLMAKTGFKNVDFTDDSLSPMSKTESESGLGDSMLLTWEASDLITNGNIGIIIPEKINPGPLTTRITYFAPVCLFFFFILIATIGIMYKINIHPMHYFFVTSGFFAFHLMLSYLAGHVWIHLAFIISASVSTLLVTFYLSAALGKQFPYKIAVVGQLFFLILFSYTFFIKGITGLIVATGSVVTLGILMKVTANVDWDEVFKSTKKDLPPPVPNMAGNK